MMKGLVGTFAALALKGVEVVKAGLSPPVPEPTDLRLPLGGVDKGRRPGKHPGAWEVARRVARPGDRAARRPPAMLVTVEWHSAGRTYRGQGERERARRLRQMGAAL